jgi:uncharacterized membrane protein
VSPLINRSGRRDDRGRLRGDALIQVPIPSGYIHLGDIAIYTGAFLFGPIVGGVSGALGPMLADLTSGYGQYAPATLVLHGLQGFLAGWIGWRAGFWRMVLATILGGVIIVAGYFLWEIAVLRIGLATATANLPFNIWQVTTGAIGGISTHGLLPSDLCGRAGSARPASSAAKRKRSATQ